MLNTDSLSLQCERLHRSYQRFFPSLLKVDQAWNGFGKPIRVPPSQPLTKEKEGKTIFC
jgi:hypothetical protein